MNKEDNPTQPNVEIKVQEPEYKDFTTFATAYNPEGFDLYGASFNRNIIPNKADLERSRTINRSNLPTGKGLWQIAVKAERNALIKGISDFSPAIDQALKSRGSDLTANDLVSMVQFLPNFNFPYYNKLIKKALEGLAKGVASTTPADYSHIQGMRVINEQAEQALLTLLRVTQDPKALGFSVLPPQSKSQLSVKYDVPGFVGQPVLPLANPGNVILQQQQQEPEIDLDPFNALVTEHMLKIDKLNDELQAMNEMQPLYQAVGFDNAVGKSLIYLRDKLLDRHINYNDLVKLAETLNKYVSLRQSKYLISLARPFQHRSARIPSLISAPSATFSLRVMSPLTTNASGNVAFILNPWYLGPSSLTWSGFSVCNGAALDGVTSFNGFLAVNIGQNLPADFYTRYRVVSAGLRIYVYPSSNNDNGMLSVSVTYDPVTVVAVGGAPAGSPQFTVFSNTENGYFKQTTTIASREVQEHCYVPLDESFSDYQPLNTPRTGFAWTGYITGAAPSTSIARIETVINYEALVDNEYTDYLPSESPVQDTDPKMVFAVLNAVKAESGPITPLRIEEAFKEANKNMGVVEAIELPPNPKEILQKQKEIQNQTNLFKKTVDSVMKVIPEKQKQTWLSTLIDKASPFVGNLLGQAISSLAPPWLSTPFNMMRKMF